MSRLVAIRSWQNLRLRRAGLLAAVESWVAALDSGVEIYWKRLGRPLRRPCFVESAGRTGLTQQQVDQLFILAAMPGRDGENNGIRQEKSFDGRKSE